MLTKYRDRAEAARLLRRRQTLPEKRLWHILRDRFPGYKFRRQLPIGPYFADFCCLEKKLLIEVDGKHHTFQMDDDLSRTTYLETQGFKVIRFSNTQVLHTISWVCCQIEKALNGVPLPVGEGGP